MPRVCHVDTRFHTTSTINPAGESGHSENAVVFQKGLSTFSAGSVPTWHTENRGRSTELQYSAIGHQPGQDSRMGLTERKQGPEGFNFKIICL